MTTFAPSGLTILPPAGPPPQPGLRKSVGCELPQRGICNIDTAFDLSKDPATNFAVFARMDPKNNPRDIQLRPVFGPVPPRWQPKYPGDGTENAQNPIDGDISLSQAPTVYDDARSVMSMSTIDGMMDLSTISHPCTITSSSTPIVRPSFAHTYVTEPSPTYQPSARYPPLPDRPRSHTIMSSWVRREAHDMERQAKHDAQKKLRVSSPIYLPIS
jgi:hypothetical protein